MIIAFIIWTLIAFVFLAIGISCGKAKEPVGFFSFVKAPAVKDVKAYNKAVGCLWLVSALLLELLGIPFLFSEQNDPGFVVVMLGVVFLMIGMMIGYLKIEEHYK